MSVDADEVHGRRLDAAANGALGRSTRYREAELRVLLPGHHVLVGVRFDARRHPHEDLGDTARAFAPQLFEAVELVVAVDDDAADADLEGVAELRQALVVAVEHQPRWRDPGAGCHVDLARGGYVDAQPFLVRDACHRLAQERLGRVGGSAVPRRRRLPAAGSQVFFVVDEQRRAVLPRKVEKIDAADAQSAVVADPRGEREQIARQRVHPGECKALRGGRLRIAQTGPRPSHSLCPGAITAARPAHEQQHRRRRSPSQLVLRRLEWIRSRQCRG